MESYCIEDFKTSKAVDVQKKRKCKMCIILTSKSVLDDVNV